MSDVFFFQLCTYIIKTVSDVYMEKKQFKVKYDTVFNKYISIPMLHVFFNVYLGILKAFL